MVNFERIIVYTIIEHNYTLINWSFRCGMVSLNLYAKIISLRQHLKYILLIV